MMTKNTNGLDRLERVKASIAAEQERIDALVARSRADRTKDIDRRAAELEVASGKTVNIGDAVIEPTPEWQEKGEFQTFTPRLEDGTVRTVSAYRRVVTPIIARMLFNGRITEDQYAACVWYRARHEAAGLDGRYKTSHISLTGNVGGGGGMSQSPMAQHEYEVEARMEFRAAREAIAPVLVRLFDAVVLRDIPLSRAKVYVQCRNRLIDVRFRAAAQDLLDHIDRCGIELR